MSFTYTFRGLPKVILILLACVFCVPAGETRLRAQPNQSAQSPTETKITATEDNLQSAAAETRGFADTSPDSSPASELAAKSVTPATAVDSPTAGWNQEQRTTRAAMLIGSFTVFLLAVFVGFEVITKVPPTLHTPLMSGSNAISGITIVGAILTAGHALGGFGAFLGMLAVILATINVVGGFLVTHRMLMMFKKR